MEAGWNGGHRRTVTALCHARRRLCECPESCMAVWKRVRQLSEYARVDAMGGCVPTQFANEWVGVHNIYPRTWHDLCLAYLAIAAMVMAIMPVSLAASPPRGVRCELSREPSDLASSGLFHGQGSLAQADMLVLELICGSNINNIAAPSKHEPAHRVLTDNAVELLHTTTGQSSHLLVKSPVATRSSSPRRCGRILAFVPPSNSS